MSLGPSLTPTGTNALSMQSIVNRTPTAPGAPGAMRHHYFIMRHGYSRANDAKQIVSYPENGVLPKFALHPKGEEQVRASATRLARALRDPRTGLSECPVVVVASPFSRTVETAKIAIDTLNKEFTAAAAARGTKVSDVSPRLLLTPHSPTIAYELRERYFGDYELKSDAHYKDIWKEDAEGLAVNRDAKIHTSVPAGQGNSKRVEPPASVWARVSALVSRLESRFIKGGSGEAALQLSEEATSDSLAAANGSSHSTKTEKHDNKKKNSGKDKSSSQPPPTQSVASSSTASPPQTRLIFILVSHGDALQLTQTAFAGASLYAHRSAVPHLSQANWRQLTAPPPDCIRAQEALKPPKAKL